MAIDTRAVEAGSATGIGRYILALLSAFRTSQQLTVTGYAGSGPPALPDAAGAGAQHAPERLVSQLVLRALREERGDVLAFLPGAREIRRVHSSLAAAQLPAGVQLMPLFGDLPGEQQLRSQVLSNPHSPPKFRVNGVVRNVDAWYAAFAVQPGDKLYLPADARVRIW